MTEPIRDEVEEHHEGQRLFTTGRMIFGCAALAAILAVGLWIYLSPKGR